MRPGLVGSAVICFVISGSPGTASASVAPVELVRAHNATHQTTAGATWVGEPDPGAAIGELRRSSGLTWDQLARLFGVDRRSLHFWASGKRMAPANEERLQRLLAVMRKIDRGSASANRAALLGALPDGALPYDHLVRGAYEFVAKQLGAGEAGRASPTPLSREAHRTRAPRAPSELVDALHDRVHPASGRLLATRPIHVHRKK
jgi:DNA-binding transcriptional regulator YiaG